VTLCRPYSHLVSVCEASEVSEREVVDGRYELVEPIGHGGMGTVYRALQKPLDREVALKFIRVNRLGEDQKKVTKRFFQEARATSELHHPHIVSLYDAGVTPDDDLYLVMELLPGQSLGDLIRSNESFRIERVAHILDQVLDALHEAHKQKIVHRDIKPDNIQIGTRGGKDDFVTLLDFGLARNSHVDRVSPDTTTIDVAGTPSYMSPEQILGTTIDPRSDIYAVGVILFEMIAGRLPFQSERAIDVYMGHLKQPVPRLRDLTSASRCTPGLQELLDRVLAKAACDRMPDALGFRQALRAVAGIPPLSRDAVPTSSSAVRQLHPPVNLGFELVAAVEPARSPGVEELIKQWTLDISQHGGTVRESRTGTVIATFPGSDTSTRIIRAALTMKQRTRAQRLSTLRPLYIRVGIHHLPSVAERLCEQAPRGGVVIGSDCVQDGMLDVLNRGLRLEAAGELRILGHRGPVRMLQVIAGR
jgi:serine/threonine protein kinase